MKKQLDANELAKLLVERATSRPSMSAQSGSWKTSATPKKKKNAKKSTPKKSVSKVRKQKAKKKK